MAAPSLSVIVTTFRRPAELERCLDSLSKQTLAGDLFEVLVIDNNSSDNTPQLVQSFMGRVPNLRYFLELKQGASHARNRGATEAQADFLLFLDDDAMAPEDYLERQHMNIQTYVPDVLGGAVFPYYTTPKPKWFKDTYEIRKYQAQAGFSLTCRVSGSNYGIRKAVLHSVGMFNPDYGPKGGNLGQLEERIVLEKYRAQTPVDQQKVYYDPEAFVYHYCPERNMHLRYLLRRAFNAGWLVGRYEAQIRSYSSGLFSRGSLMRRRIRTSIRVLLLPLRFVVHLGRAAIKSLRQPVDFVIELKRLFIYSGRTLAEWKLAFDARA